MRWRAIFKRMVIPSGVRFGLFPPDFSRMVPHSMKCFYSSSDAVGVCRSCGRGLSKEYATEFPKGLACKDKCEKDVEHLIALIERNVRLSGSAASIIRTSSSNIAMSGFFFLFMGIVFFYFGIKSRSFDLGTYIGSGFIVYAGYMLIRAARLKKTSKSASLQ